jgi:hypothetical protein
VAGRSVDGEPAECRHNRRLLGLIALLAALVAFGLWRDGLALVLIASIAGLPLATAVVAELIILS